MNWDRVGAELTGTWWQDQRLSVRVFGSQSFPAGSSCFGSNSFAVSEELAFATGQQMFDLKTTDCPYLMAENHLS